MPPFCSLQRQVWTVNILRFLLQVAIEIFATHCLPIKGQVEWFQKVGCLLFISGQRQSWHWNGLRRVSFWKASNYLEHFNVMALPGEVDNSRHCDVRRHYSQLQGLSQCTSLIPDLQIVHTASLQYFWDCSTKILWTCKHIQSATLTPYSWKRFSFTWTPAKLLRRKIASRKKKDSIYGLKVYLRNKFLLHLRLVKIIVQPGEPALLSAPGQCRCRSHPQGSNPRKPELWP